MIVVLCHTNETESWSVITLCEDALGVFLCIHVDICIYGHCSCVCKVVSYAVANQGPISHGGRHSPQYHYTHVGSGVVPPV
jgi:hypothetical protein